jgi:hypothetical protein
MTATAVEGITWEEPPSVSQRPGKYMLLLAPLVEHPGEWARIVTYDKARSAYAKAAAFASGRVPLPLTPAGEWEFIARTITPGEFAVFGRYGRTERSRDGRGASTRKQSGTPRDDGWGRSTRFYDIPDGRTVPSVTSILSIVAKPALVNWAARVEREMCVEAAANLYTDTLGGKQYVQLSRPSYITTLMARIGKQKAASKLNQKAMDIGTAVHALIEWNLRNEFGQKVGPAPKLPDGADHAFAAYQRWRQGVKLTPLAIEQMVWSSTYGYGGTMDLYAELDIDGKPARGILDWKTGKGIYGEALLQSVAYIQALVEMGHAESPVHGLVVRFPKTAADAPFEVRVIRPESQLHYFDAFLAAKLWEWNEEKQRTAQRGGNIWAGTGGVKMVSPFLFFPLRLP